MDYANDPPSKLTAGTSAVEHEGEINPMRIAAPKSFSSKCSFDILFVFLHLCRCQHPGVICAHGHLSHLQIGWKRKIVLLFAFLFSCFRRSASLNGHMPGEAVTLYFPNPLSGPCGLFSLFPHFPNPLSGSRGLFSGNGGSRLLDSHISTMPSHTKPL